MESFFSLLQKNVRDHQQWLTSQDIRLALTTWIEENYHRQRRQRRLGKLTLIENGTINRTALTAT
jgi:putative transposase